MTFSRTLEITRLAPPTDRRQQLADDVRDGLRATPKTLPPKWFYDARGSELFEQITRLPEYYLTRAETEILTTLSDPLMAAMQPAELVELGSGSSRKTRLLLEAMWRHTGRARYAPVDVSEDALEGAATTLAADYPWLDVHGFIGDFTADLPHVPRDGRRLLAFLGSTIGNFQPTERVDLLRAAGSALDDGDRLLLGIDLVKDRATLEAAYDDPAGITAEFNRNLLHVLNRELECTLPVDAFDHVAFYDPHHQRIEMRLRARHPITAHFPTLPLQTYFAVGEELHTEISCKFTRATVEHELTSAGLRLRSWHTDPTHGFACVVAARA